MHTDVNHASNLGEVNWYALRNLAWVWKREIVHYVPPILAEASTAIWQAYLNAEVRYGMNWDQYLMDNYVELAVAFARLQFQVYLNHWDTIKYFVIAKIQDVEYYNSFDFNFYWQTLEATYPAAQYPADVI
jgi:hypothetical protein